MTPNAIKKYLHSVTITKKEAELVRDLMQENKEDLKEFLPLDKKSHKYFLTDLLSAALKDSKNNKDFIQTILSLKNDDNKDSFYYCLSNTKYGLELIKANPTLFNENINKSFEEILYKGSGKSILEFVKENKDKINIETIYKASLDLKVIKSLEKEGYNFDERILNVAFCKANLKKPVDLLQYMETIEPKCQEKVWNNTIISMLKYYDRELWDWNGKDKFGDCFYLITKLKNPGQYKWGQEVKGIKEISGHYVSGHFSFSNALSAYLNTSIRVKLPSINGEGPIDLNIIKDFFKTNNILFNKYWESNIILNFTNELSDEVINSAIQSNWPNLFRFEESKHTKYGNYNKDIIFDSLYKQEELPVFKNERIRKAILKEYFSQPKYRLDSYDTQRFFEILGLTEKAICEKKALFKYTDIFYRENVAHICKALKMEHSVAEKIVAEFEVEALNREMTINESDVKQKKLKI